MPTPPPLWRWTESAPGGRSGWAWGGGRPRGGAGVAGADAAGVVEVDGVGSGGDVQHGVEEGPVGDGVGAVAHSFRLAVGRGDGAGVEVVARHGDGPDLALAHELVHREGE